VLSKATTTARTGIQFVNDTKTYEIGTAGSANTTYPTNAFYIYDSTATALRFVVNTSGNVGIGQANPTDKLVVNGVVNATSYKLGGTTVDLSAITSVTAGTATISKALIVDASLNITGIGNIGASTLTLGATSIGATQIGYLTSITAGTVSASKAVIVDSSSNISGFNSISITRTATGDSWVSTNGTTTIKLTHTNNGIGLIGSSTASSFGLMANNAEKITILSGGNVGINKTSPSYQLDVSGTVNSDSLIRTTRTTDGAPFLSINGSSTCALYHFNNGDAYFGTTTANTLQLQTNNNARLAISSIGNIIMLGATRSQASWTTVGPVLNIEVSTITDTSTAASGTVALRAGTSIQDPVFASTNAITVTSAATLYIDGGPVAGTNTTITNSYGLFVNAAINASSYYISGVLADFSSITGVTAGTVSASKAVIAGVSKDIAGFNSVSAARISSGFSFYSTNGSGSGGIFHSTNGSLYIGNDSPHTTYILSNNTSRIGISATGNISFISATRSQSSWSTIGPVLDIESSTITDTSTAAAGTVALRVGTSIQDPTFASTNAITVTNAATLYIDAGPAAGTNTTITNRYGLYVNANNSYFGGDIITNNSTIRPSKTSDGYVLLSTNGTSQYGVYHINNDMAYIGTISAHTFAIVTNDTFRITILSNGNVGIGSVVTPGYLLDVGGTINTNTLFRANRTTTGDVFSSVNGTSTFVVNHTLNGNVAIGTSNANTLTLRTNGIDNIAINAIGNVFFLAANRSQTAWTTIGPIINIETSIITDTSTAASGTVALRAGTSIQEPTFASTNAITVTNAATLYIDAGPVAGTNTTITNRYGLYVNANKSYFGDQVEIKSTTNHGLTITNATSASTADALFVSNTYSGEIGVRGSTASVNPNQFYIFYNGAVRFNITSAGLIGINNASPAYALDVGGIICSTRTGGGQMFLSTSSGSTFEIYNASAIVYIGTITAADLYLETNNTTRMTITAAGSVGIGNVGPSYKLDVNGTFRATGSALVDNLSVGGTNAGITSAGWIGVGGTSPIAPIHCVLSTSL
jgi:hypothetical protein